MTVQNCDVLVLGGGCSGLALGYYYAQEKMAKASLTIIEKRSEYTNDRTWCFWLSEPHFEHLDIIFRTWSSWRLSGADNSIQRKSSTIPYAVIRACDYYRKTQHAILQDARQRLELHTDVLSIQKIQERYFVETSSGTFCARQIIDTRPDLQKIRQSAPIFQIFYGQEIQATEDAFDESEIILMGNLSSEKSVCRFDYVLPFSKSHALVEKTHFTTVLTPPMQLKAECDSLLQGYTSRFELIREESGILPMGIAKSKALISNAYDFNQQSGSLRASSGYGFLRIQQEAKTLARNIAEQKPLRQIFVDSAFERFMDRYFCKVLVREMPHAHRFFLDMANKLSPEDFARFLNGSATWRLRAKVITSMPFKPFLRALL